MTDYITTYSGAHFTPTQPDPKQIHIADIAHALSLTCRGNGQVKTFFSVGQHCINCALEAEARGYSPRVVLACLLHDASESYLSDVPSPLKQYLADYNRYEDQVLGMIYRKYLGSALAKEEQRQVKEIDKSMLYYDLLELLGEVSDGPKPTLAIKLSYEVKAFSEVERQYLELFRKYDMR